MADEDQQRNEDASPHKLAQARRKGSVPKGQDLNAFLALLALAGVLYCSEKLLGDGMASLARLGLSATWSQVASQAPLSLPLAMFGAHLRLWAGLLALLLACAVLGCLLQSGPVFSLTPLKPDWKRLNISEGYRRFLSMKLLLDALRSLMKILFLGLALAWFMHDVLPQLLALPGTDVRRLPAELLRLGLRLLVLMLLALAPVVALDILFSRRDYARRMRMSRRELREEHKQREGDPRIRARQKALQKEARKRSASLRRVKQSDLLVTNPTRLAVALRYDASTMEAPTVLAKGAGQLAALMREMAWRHQVPVVQNRRLAAQLFRHAAIDQAIPPDSYLMVARLLVWLRTRQAARTPHAPTGPAHPGAALP